MSKPMPRYHTIYTKKEYIDLYQDTACPFHFEIGGTCTSCISNLGVQANFWGYTPSSMTTHVKPKPVETNEISFFFYYVAHLLPVLVIIIHMYKPNQLFFIKT